MSSSPADTNDPDLKTLRFLALIAARDIHIYLVQI